METFIIAEIGINHNGDLEVARKLIDMAAVSGCSAVKFQKRTIDNVYTKEMLESHRESPWGDTQRKQKAGLEFGEKEYDFIDDYCSERGIEWFASAWDVDSQRFLQRYNLKYNKIASAMLTYEPLVLEIARERKKTFISTGMSNLDEIDRAVSIFRDENCPFELMHSVSTYPASTNDIDLNCIPMLRERYSCDVGYSGHETAAFAISLGAVALGATSLERHITLDRSMYGSDQSASVEAMGLMTLVRSVRTLEQSLGGGEKRITEDEKVVRGKLRWFEN